MSKPNKVMLITPNYHCGVVESAGRWPNLAFIFIAGELERAGFDVEIYDAMSLFHDYDKIRERIADRKPDFVGSTAITATLNDAVKVLTIAKEECPDCMTFLGGIHPTFCFKEILEQHGSVVDYVVIGEGEKTAPELLEAHRSGGNLGKVNGIAYLDEGRMKVTLPRGFMKDLDALSPAWHLVNWSDYPLYFIDNSKVAIVSSSRGCVYTCVFCSQHKFWEGGYRQRSAECFVTEVEHLAKTYGINCFFIADEYPTANRNRWVRILQLLIEKDLGIHILMETTVRDIVRDEDIMHLYRKAGIMFIYVGVEATSEEKLAEFKKKHSFVDSQRALQIIQNADIICESALILGTPNETPETVKQSLQLAKEYNGDFMHFLFIAPWPYADMYADLKPHIVEWDYSKYNLVEPIVKPINMSLDEIHQAVLYCYREYYMYKFPQWIKLPDGLKRRALIQGIKSIMDNSFLKKHMTGLGGMPAGVRKLLDYL